MPRKPRVLLDGATYHVYARGNDRRAIFRDDADRRLYVVILRHVLQVRSWQCHACCLMGNHVHLLVETTHADLDAGIRLLHGLYAQRHNRRHGRSGHLFQGRYGASLILSDTHFHATATYIVRNPVDAGLCARPDHWPWTMCTASLAEALGR